MSQEKKIGPNTFTVQALPAMRAFCLQPRIAPFVAEVGTVIVKTIQEVAGKVKRGPDGKVDPGAVVATLIDDYDVEMLAPAIARAAAKLPPSELEAVTRELLQGARMDGVQLLPLATEQSAGIFNTAMMGRTLDTWRLLIFAVQVNYPDFFLAFGKGASAASPKAESSPAT